MITGTCVTSYYITDVKLNFDNSMAACSALDEQATLAMPQNAEENMAVWEMRQSVGGSLYIGHHEHDDAEGNRKWAWFDGSEMSYTNWHAGEPNNDARAGLDCGEIGRFRGPTWNDIRCTTKQRAICQIITCGGTIAPDGFVDPLTVEVEPYTEADHSVMVSAPKTMGLDGLGVGETEGLYEHACEEAIGHDGHYDEATNVWILDNDYDAEPEWRCLMRPFLKYGTKRVEAGELSIEAKTVVEEKKRLIAVHERLVAEADLDLKQKQCMNDVEIHMAKLEECELAALRTYSRKSTPKAHDYPQQWQNLLIEKKLCVDRFAEDAQKCRWVWQPQWDRYYKDFVPEMMHI